ncbi:rolling circle replication-associated protein [Xenophilus azovorans]|uniref:rolling circle replication-associated protein n=1 Tax=Xenophilus azovorans TaxID=151755 RepID=UPI001FDFD8C0|nr:hypothetical protein [Xenophilus azovorans]
MNVAAVATLRASSQARFLAAWESHEARAARGLVSVSTSGLAALPTAMQWAEGCITIDRAAARVTRLRKAVGVASKCHLNLSEGTGENNVMVTLTYRGNNDDWQPRHVSDYIRKVRLWFKDRCPGQKLRYVWVAELQQRGVIHYHAVFFLPAGVRMPHADRKGWWPHGSTNTLKATAPVAYLMKYASKVQTKNVGGFPRGARIHGCGGLDAVGAAIRRWCLWPAYVQGNAAVGDAFKPAQGGGYLNADTGELLRSEWAPTGGGYSCFIRVRECPRRVDASGPFSWLPGVGEGDACARVLH